MDHDETCDCHFQRSCATFNDSLIEDARKGPEGFGCRGGNDVYRGKHCRTFRCSYLTMVLSDTLKQPLPGQKRSEA